MLLCPRLGPAGLRGWGHLGCHLLGGLQACRHRACHPADPLVLCHPQGHRLEGCRLGQDYLPLECPQEPQGCVQGCRRPACRLGCVHQWVGLLACLGCRLLVCLQG